MNLKDLISAVETLKEYAAVNEHESKYTVQLRGIRQTVEAVDNHITFDACQCQQGDRNDWQKLKTLLEIKE